MWQTNHVVCTTLRTEIALAKDHHSPFSKSSALLNSDRKLHLHNKITDRSPRGRSNNKSKFRLQVPKFNLSSSLIWTTIQRGLIHKSSFQKMWVPLPLHSTASEYWMRPLAIKHPHSTTICSPFSLSHLNLSQKQPLLQPQPNSKITLTNLMLPWIEIEARALQRSANQPQSKRRARSAFSRTRTNNSKTRSRCWGPLF